MEHNYYEMQQTDFFNLNLCKDFELHAIVIEEKFHGSEDFNSQNMAFSTWLQLVDCRILLQTKTDLKKLR